MSPINSIANPVVFFSITTAPQKFSMVTSLKPDPGGVWISGLLETGSILICPCLKSEGPIMKEAVGIVAGESNGWLVLAINILFVSREEIVNVKAVPNAEEDLITKIQFYRKRIANTFLDSVQNNKNQIIKKILR